MQALPLDRGAAQNVILMLLLLAPQTAASCRHLLWLTAQTAASHSSIHSAAEALNLAAVLCFDS